MEIIEWAEFRLKAGVALEQCLAASGEMQTAFLDQQPGFLHRSTVQLGANLYADVVTWASEQAADRAMQAAMEHPACSLYFSMLQVDAAPRLAHTVWHSSSRGKALQGVEFSLFQLKTSADAARLSQAAQAMVDQLYRPQPGFIHHQVLCKPDGWFADVLLASSVQRAQELCNLWHEPQHLAACQDYLDLIEPSSIQMAFWQSIK